MDYGQVNTVIDREKLIDYCLEYNKQPGDIVKWLLNNEYTIDNWNRAHIERGVLKNVTKVPVGNSFYLNVDIEKSKPDKYSGETLKTTRTQFQNNDDLFNKLQSMIGQHAKFYISYNKDTNAQDPESAPAYRVLLDANL